MTKQGKDGLVSGSGGREFHHIHILGASGAGTTTLAAALCAVLPHVHLDSDDFYWKKKFSEDFPRQLRLARLLKRMDRLDSWVLSGAVIDWGNPLMPLFDLVVFLSLPHGLRMKRLEQRERKRYGESIRPGGEHYASFQSFMDWAALYETGGVEVRSRVQQEEWMKGLACPVLRISAPDSVEANRNRVLRFMESGGGSTERDGFSA